MEQIFEKINALFCEYLKASEHENTENAKSAIEEKIMLTVWKANKNYRDYSYEVVKKVKESLNFFPKSEAYRNGGNFSKYLYSSISAAIKVSKTKESLEENNGGITMPDNVIKDIKKIRDLKKMFPDIDEDEFIKKAANLLKTEDSKIKHLIEIMNSTTGGIAIENKETGDIVFLPDMQETSDKDPLFEEVFNQNDPQFFLSLIEKKWKKKQDPMLSELLTIFLLKKGFDVEDIENYTFINKEICEACSKDPGSKLPTDQEIVKKYGKTDKSSATYARQEFFKIIKESLKES